MNETKSGYKTTEFWLTAITSVVSLLWASGLIVDGSNADKVFGLLSAGLASLGYAVSRGIAKK